MMKITTLLLLLAPVSLFGQDQREEQGYFTNPRSTPYGTVCSNNYASSLYLVENGSLHELLTAAGCGGYYSVSADGQRIGLKLIDEDGFQTPAVYDLSKRSLLMLSTPGRQVGQVSFTADGRVAFTRGEDLVVRVEGREEVFPLGT